MLALTDKPEELRSYLWKLNDDLTTVDTVLKTGNVMVDAILNSKLSLIKSKHIAVNAKASVISWTMPWRPVLSRTKIRRALFASISAY